jgi:hypothetical protein
MREVLKTVGSFGDNFLAIKYRPCLVQIGLLLGGANSIFIPPGDCALLSPGGSNAVGRLSTLCRGSLGALQTYLFAFGEFNDDA